MTTLALSTGLTTELARTAVEWRHPQPEAAVTLAEQAVVDTVGVALAARHDITVASLLHGLADDVRGGPATVWVNGAASDARTAALLNGTSAHALDFDDVDDQMIGHPSAVMVPAVLATGEEVGAPGPRVVEAYWVGLAVCRALAAALDIDSHYRAGWHSTGTIGAVGAAAACARLRGLGLEEARFAIGIAGSLAAGSRQNFGTMTKPLHAGVAASTGVLAAKLAAVGYTSDEGMLERPLGFLALHDGAPGERRVEQEAMAEPRLNVKLHACCYYIHAAADAMLELRADGLTAEDVRRIRVTGPSESFAALIHHRPVTGLQGKFSMEYAMAGCLLDGALGLTTFTDEAVGRPEAHRMVELVELHSSATPPVGPQEWTWSYAVVTVETRDGRRLEKRVDKPRGHATRPLEDTDLRRKFDGCLAYGALDASTPLFDLLRNLHDLDAVSDATAAVAALARSGQ
jgi:2-methylcitrate dehydratase PrpD